MMLVLLNLLFIFRMLFTQLFYCLISSVFKGEVRFIFPFMIIRKDVSISFPN